VTLGFKKGRNELCIKRAIFKSPFFGLNNTVPEKTLTYFLQIENCNLQKMIILHSHAIAYKGADETFTDPHLSIGFGWMF
jgi:hypothetical protein